MGDQQALKPCAAAGAWVASMFKQQKLEELDGQVGQHHFGQMRLEVAQAKAERIITETLRQFGWQETDLISRRKRDPAKLQIAVRLRKETTLSVKQIAARLHLGTPASASVCMRSSSCGKATTWRCGGNWVAWVAPALTGETATVATVTAAAAGARRPRWPAARRAGADTKRTRTRRTR